MVWPTYSPAETLNPAWSLWKIWIFCEMDFEITHICCTSNFMTRVKFQFAPGPHEKYIVQALSQWVEFCAVIMIE